MQDNGSLREPKDNACETQLKIPGKPRTPEGARSGESPGPDQRSMQRYALLQTLFAPGAPPSSYPTYP